MDGKSVSITQILIKDSSARTAKVYVESDIVPIITVQRRKDKRY